MPPKARRGYALSGRGLGWRENLLFACQKLGCGRTVTHDPTTNSLMLTVCRAAVAVMTRGNKPVAVVWSKKPQPALPSHVEELRRDSPNVYNRMRNLLGVHIGKGLRLFRTTMGRMVAAASSWRGACGSSRYASDLYGGLKGIGLPSAGITRAGRWPLGRLPPGKWRCRCLHPRHLTHTPPQTTHCLPAGTMTGPRGSTRRSTTATT